MTPAKIIVDRDDLALILSRYANGNTTADQASDEAFLRLMFALHAEDNADEPTDEASPYQPPKSLGFMAWAMGA